MAKKKTQVKKAAEMALERAISAIGQLDTESVDTKRVTKTDRVGEGGEKITETVEYHDVVLKNTVIDTSALKQITASLKDIRDLLEEKNPQDTEGETGVIALPLFE